MNQRVGASEPAPISRLSLRSNFRWTFAGNVVSAASRWGMLAVLARLGSPKIVGQFVLGLAIAAPIMAFTMMQLRSVQVTDAQGEYEFEDYFGTRIAWTLLGLAIISVYAWLGPFEADTAWVIFGVGMTKAIDSVTDLVRGLFQRYERMDYSGTSLMIKGPSALAAMGLVMWFTRSIVPAVAAMAGVWVLSFTFYDMVRAKRLLAWCARSTGASRRFTPRFSGKTILKLTWIALPLGVVMFLISLQTNIPRYLLEGYAGHEALGYFGAMVYPMVAATLVTGAMGQSASPRLARYFLNDLAAYRALLRKLLLLGASLGIALVLGTALLGRPLLQVLYGADYARHHREFVVLAIASGIQLVTSFWGYGLTSARVFRLQVVLALISCVVTTITAMVLIPKWQVMGAALTVALTAGVMFFCFLAAVGRTIAKKGRALAANQ